MKIYMVSLLHRATIIMHNRPNDGYTVFYLWQDAATSDLRRPYSAPGEMWWQQLYAVTPTANEGCCVAWLIWYACFLSVESVRCNRCDVTSFEISQGVLYTPWISLNVDEPCTQAACWRQHWQQDKRSDRDVPSRAPLEHWNTSVGVCKLNSVCVILCTVLEHAMTEITS